MLPITAPNHSTQFSLSHRDITPQNNASRTSNRSESVTIDLGSHIAEREAHIKNIKESVQKYLSENPNKNLAALKTAGSVFTTSTLAGLAGNFIPAASLTPTIAGLIAGITFPSSAKIIEILSGNKTADHLMESLEKVIKQGKNDLESDIENAINIVDRNLTYDEKKQIVSELQPRISPQDLLRMALVGGSLFAVTSSGTAQIGAGLAALATQSTHVAELLKLGTSIGVNLLNGQLLEAQNKNMGIKTPPNLGFMVGTSLGAGNIAATLMNMTLPKGTNPLAKLPLPVAVTTGMSVLMTYKGEAIRRQLNNAIPNTLNAASSGYETARNVIGKINPYSANATSAHNPNVLGVSYHRRQDSQHPLDVASTTIEMAEPSSPHDESTRAYLQVPTNASKNSAPPMLQTRESVQHFAHGTQNSRRLSI